MKKLDKRKFVIVTVNTGWILFMLSILLPIGQRGFPENGVATMEVVDKVVAYPIGPFWAFLYGNQPYRGPGGTPWDQMKRTDNPVMQMKWALKNAVQFGSSELQDRQFGPVNPDKVPVDPAKITKQLRAMAKMLGAADARVCELDQRFVYPSDKAGSPVFYPHRYAISIILEEELGHPFPPGDHEYAPAFHGKVAHGYFLMDYVAGQVADYIRSLGYPAAVHPNGNLHSVAIAVLAGHGELGRHGQLITKKYGPNVRICTITTDIALVTDSPVDIGVQHFCERCTLCAEYCPGSAIPLEKSATRGVMKFACNYQRCRRATVAGTGVDVLSHTCSICRHVCPWAKEGKYWLHRFGRYIVSRSWVAREVMLQMDYILYSRENRYDMKRVVDDMRARIKKSWEVMPDDSELWMTVGSRSDEEGEKARQYYVKKYPYWFDFSGSYRPSLYPWAGTDNPNFGKFPEWTDPWGRVVKGGERGASGLDPAVDFPQMFGGGSLVGSGGFSVPPFMLKKPPKGTYRLGWARFGDPMADYTN
jgi:ferredoxin